MGCYLAKAGVKCVIFERELFPPAVVESFSGSVGNASFPRSGVLSSPWRRQSFLTSLALPGLPKDQGGAYDMNFNGGFKDKAMAPETHVDIRFNERLQEGVDREYTLPRGPQ